MDAAPSTLAPLDLKNRAAEIAAEMAELQATRDDLSNQKKAATKAFRNLQKTTKRLKKKSSALSTKDLVDVLALRVAKEKQKQEQQAAQQKLKQQTPAMEVP